MGELFEGKVALVTGASSGIGRATAIAFARGGAKVVVAARRVAESEETVRLIEAAGGSALFVQTDVSKSPQVQALVARTIEHYGALDIAVNNAGQDPDAYAPVHKYDEALWDRILATNLTGMFPVPEVRVAAHRGVEGRDREHGLGGRSDGRAHGLGLLRQQAWRSRADTRRGDGIRTQGCAHQCSRPGGDRHADG